MQLELVPPPLQAWGIYKERQLSEITTLMFHRIGPRLPDKAGIWQPMHDAAQIAEWFSVNGMRETGSPKMPYTFVIPPAGPKVYQAVPLKCVTPHALKWNRTAVSIAFIGDFRLSAPTAFQVEAAKWVAMRVQDTIGRPLTLERHTLVPGGSNHPKGHECPGAKFDKAFFDIEDFWRKQSAVTK